MCSCKSHRDKCYRFWTFDGFTGTPRLTYLLNTPTPVYHFAMYRQFYLLYEVVSRYTYFEPLSFNSTFSGLSNA